LPLPLVRKPIAGQKGPHSIKFEMRKSSRRRRPAHRTSLISPRRRRRVLATLLARRRLAGTRTPSWTIGCASTGYGVCGSRTRLSRRPSYPGQEPMPWLTWLAAAPPNLLRLKC